MSGPSEAEVEAALVDHPSLNDPVARIGGYVVSAFVKAETAKALREFAAAIRYDTLVDLGYTVVGQDVMGEEADVVEQWSNEHGCATAVCTRYDSQRWAHERNVVRWGMAADRDADRWDAVGPEPW